MRVCSGVVSGPQDGHSYVANLRHQLSATESFSDCSNATGDVIYTEGRSYYDPRQAAALDGTREPESHSISGTIARFVVSMA